MTANTHQEIVLKNLNIWNAGYPNYQLSADDLKNPQALMGALFLMFEPLGIASDIVLAPPPEEYQNEHVAYYWDLLPVINMTRVINHLVYPTPGLNAQVTIAHFLQPNGVQSVSILLLFNNLILFKKERLMAISVKEEELFAMTDQVKALEDEKNRLLENLNIQAEEKGKRDERLIMLNEAIKQYEEDLEHEKEVHNEEKLELEALEKEIGESQILLQHKKSVKDALLEEVAKKRALRVYDADELKAKGEKAAQNVVEAEKKLNSLQIMLIQGENNLKNLQTIQPTLDTANNLLSEIVKFSDRLKDLDGDDLESDDSELYMLNTEVGELQAKLSEIKINSAEAAKKRLEGQAKRQQENTTAQSSVLEAVTKDKYLFENCKKAMQRTEEIKEATLKYEAEKTRGLEQLADIKNNFTSELKTANEMLLKKATEVARIVEEKLQNKHI